MKEYIEKIKNMFGSNVDQKRKNQNLVLAIILLVISLVAINNIFSENKTTGDKSTLNDGKTTTVETSKINNTSNNISNTEYTELEGKLKAILEQISGISEVSVMLTYSSYGKMVPVYDVKEDVNIEESGVANSNKTSQKTVTEKNVAYEEQDSSKKVIVESMGAPIVEGAIITAKGLNSSDINMRIKEAVATVTNIPIYKVQVFEK